MDGLIQAIMQYFGTPQNLNNIGSGQGSGVKGIGGQGLPTFGGSSTAGQQMPQQQMPSFIGEGQGFGSAMPPGQGGGGGGGGMSQGFMDGMGSSGRGKLDTSASDHAMGLSAMQQYRDMSTPQNGLTFLTAMQGLANNQPQYKGPQAKPMHGYLQQMLAAMRGGQ